MIYRIKSRNLRWVQCKENNSKHEKSEIVGTLDYSPLKPLIIESISKKDPSLPLPNVGNKTNKKRQY